MPSSSPRNPGWFRRVFDPRRRVLTQEERRRGGVRYAGKFTTLGRWYPDGHERSAGRRKEKRDGQ